MKTRLFVSHESALWFWRWLRTTSEAVPSGFVDAASRPRHIRSLEGATSSGRVAMGLLRGLLGESDGRLTVADVFGRRLHTLACSDASRIEMSGFVSHVQSETVPPGAFVSLGNGVCVASPEFCFAQLAPKLGWGRRILLADELCGTYAIPPSGMGERAYEVAPLATVRRIMSQLERLPHARGTRGALCVQAMAYAVDNAGSPMESVVTTLLVAPYRHGGYGFAKPILNPMLDEQGHLTSRRHLCRYKPDLFWPSANLDLEYDGRETHIDSNSYEDDSARADDLRRFGIKVIQVTRRKVMNVDIFDSLAREAAADLGRRVRTDRCDGFAVQRACLRREILPKGRGQGGLADRG